MSQNEANLTNAQRTDLMAQLERDGYFVLPEKLPADLNQRCIEAIDRLSAGAGTSVKMQNCVDLDAVFLELMLYQPALQLAYDALGPMFHLCQSNFVRRVCDNSGAGRAGFRFRHAVARRWAAPEFVSARSQPKRCGDGFALSEIWLFFHRSHARQWWQFASRARLTSTRRT